MGQEVGIGNLPLPPCMPEEYPLFAQGKHLTGGRSVQNVTGKPTRKRHAAVQKGQTR